MLTHILLGIIIIILLVIGYMIFAIGNNLFENKK